MISFPRPMPIVGSVSGSFEIERVDYLSPEAGGRMGAVAAGSPLWRMSLSLTNMDVARGDIWRAWVAVQRGPGRTFFGYDVVRRVPRLHAGGRPFTKQAASWSQAVNADGLALLTLTGLMPGMTLSLGDYVGFRWGTDRRSIVRVVAGASVGATGSLIVAVEPPVPTITPAAAVAVFDRPDCLMRLVPGEASMGEQGLGGLTSAGGSIVAIQDLLP